MLSPTTALLLALFVGFGPRFLAACAAMADDRRNGVRDGFTVVLFAIALIAATLSAAAQENPPSPIPDLPSAAIEISWSDLKALIEKTIPPPENAPPAPKPKPPIPWTIASATYDAVAESAASLRIDAQFLITVWEEDEWTTIPILGDTVAVGDAQLDGAPTSLGRTDSGMLALVLQDPGEHAVDVTFYAKLAAKDGTVTFEFPSVPVPSTRMTLHIPDADAVIASDLANSVVSQRDADGLTARLAFPPTTTIRGQWSLPAKVPEPAAPPEPARVACTTSTYLAVGDRYTACHSLLRFDVLRGATDSFRARLPESANVLAVTGQGAAWTVEPGEGVQYLDIKVNRPIEDHYEVTVTYEAPHAADAAVVAMPAIAAENVTRESGQIGVSGRGAIELAESADSAGLTRIDVSELAADIRNMSPTPILFAYRYADHGYLLALDVHRLEDAPVRVASIDHANILTSITDHGMAITRVEYAVRNNVKQFLRVQVAPDAEIWTAEVGGEVVKPARDRETSAVLIPLRKSADLPEGQGAFTVALTYMERVEPPKGLRSKFDVTAPAADILANDVAWTVHMPDNRVVTGSDGDAEPLPKPRRRSRFDDRPGILREYDGVATERIYRLRDGIERFFITDINNPGASTGSMGDRYQGGQLAPAPSDTAVAGVLPVKVSFPIQGAPNGFRSVLVPQDTALQLSLYTVPAWLVTAVNGVKGVAALALGFVASVFLTWRAAVSRCVVIAAGYAAVVLVLWWNLDSVPFWVTYAEAAFAIGLIRPLVRHGATFRAKHDTSENGIPVRLDESESAS